MTDLSEKNYPLTAKDYEVYEEIGDDVYRAHCIELDEIVAVKIVSLEKCNNDVEAIRKQAHPNPHCSFIDGESLWVVMPFLLEDDEEEDIPLSDIFSGNLSPGKLSPIREEEEELHSSSDNSDELKDDEVVNSGIPATVNPLPSSNTAQILPMLQNLLISNTIQRERLMGLIQVYDPTAVTEGNEQILTKEEELSAEVQYLDRCVQGLREEIDDLKKVNAELEDEINRLKNNTDQ